MELYGTAPLIKVKLGLDRVACGKGREAQSASELAVQISGVTSVTENLAIKSDFHRSK